MNALTTVYKIRNARSKLVAEHVREDLPDGTKMVLWRLPDGTWGLNGTGVEDLPLYGAEMVSDFGEDALILVTEGEKARDAIKEAGLPAVGTVTGAGKTPGPGALEVLRDRRVLLWPDTDDAGSRHMRNVAENLHSVAAEILFYTWHEAPEVWLEGKNGKSKLKAQDAADHPAVQSRNPKAVDRLLTDLEGAPRWEPEEPPSPNGRGDRRDRGRFEATDLGNSERFVANHSEDVYYCYPLGKWFVWAGSRWKIDDAGAVQRLAKETVRGVLLEAHRAAGDETSNKLTRWAMTSQSEARIRAMLELAKSELPISPDGLDADPDFLNCINGTVDLRTGELRSHRREDHITKLAPVEYAPESTAPVWRAFLERVLPTEELRSFVRRAVGYSITGDTSEQCLFINYGPGANGKSTFQEAIAAALGDYAMRTPTETLMAKRTGAVPNDVARLKGARFVAASETEEGRRLAESVVKDLTGQDTISARFMRAEWFDFKPTHKLWLSTNHRPEIRGTDNAIWRRIRLIPWTVTVPPAERDHKLAEKLRVELPGILVWMVSGCLEWRRDGLRAPDEVKRATVEYRAEMDVLAGFLADCCETGERHRSYARELYATYKRWCADTGEAVESQKKFGGRLAERGFLKERDGRTGRSMWFGLHINAEWSQSAEPSEGSLNLSPNHSNTSFAGETDSSERSEPENTINPLTYTSRGVIRKNGSDGSEGSDE